MKLPSNVVSEILQLAGCKTQMPSPRGPVDFDFSSAANDDGVGGLKAPYNDYVNAKAKEFLYEIVDKTLTITGYCHRIEAVPHDLARALRLFAEEGLAASGPRFVFDYSSDDGRDVWVDQDEYDDEDMKEDMNVTDSMIDDDDYYYSWSDDEEVSIHMNVDVCRTETSKLHEDTLMSIFYAKYPECIIEGLTDKQFRKEVLVPFFNPYPYYRLYMGFDFEEEDYADETDEDVHEFYVCWTAPVMIGMLKRAMYAFVVASIREEFEQKSIQKLQTQVASNDEDLERRAAKEEEMQARIQKLRTKVASDKELKKEMQAQIQKLRTQVASNDKELERRAAKEEETQAQIQELQTQVASNDKELEKRAAKEEEMQAQIQKLRTQVASNNKELKKRAAKDVLNQSWISKLETQVASNDKELEKKAAKEEEMQARIDFLQEQLKKSMPETVDLTNDTQLPQSKEDEEAEEQPPSERQHTESGRSTGIEGSGPRTRSTIREVPVKLENIKDGLIKCPDPGCGNMIAVSEKGCKLQVCRKHTPQFLYFCAHCQKCKDPFAEALDCDCPRRNTPEDRERAQEMRNKRARKNPLVLE